MGGIMARYMFQAAYTMEALAMLASRPQERSGAARALLASMGATLESFDFALGEYDVVAIYTAPDDTAAAAIALAICAAGHLKAFKTTKLLSSEEFQAACRQASAVRFEGPSRT
jgi:uncharacterized protein with GYD domain